MQHMLGALAETNRHLENIAQALRKNIKTETQTAAISAKERTETLLPGIAPETSLDLYECAVESYSDGTLKYVWHAFVHTDVMCDTLLAQILLSQLRCARGVEAVEVGAQPRYMGRIGIIMRVNDPDFNKNKPMLPPDVVDIIERLRRTNRVERVQYSSK